MKLDKLRIAKSAITDNVFVGEIGNDGSWKNKKDITDDFIKAVVDMYAGYRQVVRGKNRTFEIIVKEIKDTKPNGV